MKKSYLIPLFALSLVALPLAGCDDQTESTASAPEAVSESVETPTTVTTEEAAAATAEAQQQGIVVSNATAYATAPSATTGAIFATISNGGAEADFLLSATTDVAETVELHQTYEDPQTGATLMRKTAGVDVAANGDTKLEPNGFHIMLLGLKGPLMENIGFNVTLTFREAGDIVVPVTVMLPGVTSESHEGHAPVASAADATAEAAPVEATPEAPSEAPAQDAAPAQQ